MSLTSDNIDTMQTVTSGKTIPFISDAQLIKGARALADRHAKLCGINADDNWKEYSDDFIQDVKVIMDGIGGA